jgi:hypothetical protein
MRNIHKISSNEVTWKIETYTGGSENVYVRIFSRREVFTYFNRWQHCSKRCHLKYKDVTSFTILTEKGRKEIKVCKG